MNFNKTDLTNTRFELLPPEITAYIADFVENLEIANAKIEHVAKMKSSFDILRYARELRENSGVIIVFPFTTAISMYGKALEFMEESPIRNQDWGYFTDYISIYDVKTVDVLAKKSNNHVEVMLMSQYIEDNGQYRMRFYRGSEESTEEMLIWLQNRIIYPPEYRGPRNILGSEIEPKVSAIRAKNPGISYTDAFKTAMMEYHQKK